MRLGPEGRLVASTPLGFWLQAHQNPDDLKEHLIAVPAQSLLALQPLMFHLHSRFLVGTFVFPRKSLALIDRFVPVTDRGFGLAPGRAPQWALGHKADDVLYFVS